MISANNNVRNITKAVNNLSEKYGKEIIFNDKKYYLFPSLDDMKKLNLEDYINLKLGFRSKYIYDFVKNINEEDINKINELDTIAAIKYLTSFNGIGLKIASCILLFGYKRLDVFPIDTWVKKYMMDNYGLLILTKLKNMQQINMEKIVDSQYNICFIPKEIKLCTNVFCKTLFLM